jgi:hypothetical protein
LNDSPKLRRYGLESRDGYWEIPESSGEINRVNNRKMVCNDQFALFLENIAAGRKSDKKLNGREDMAIANDRAKNYT